LGEQIIEFVFTAPSGDQTNYLESWVFVVCQGV